MDVLGDLGTRDQLEVARSENAVLTRRVAVLTQEVQELTMQLTRVQAQLDLYRSEEEESRGVSSRVTTTTTSEGLPDDDVVATFGHGNNVIMNHADPSHPRSDRMIPQKVWSNLHGNSNPVCVSLLVSSPPEDERIVVVTGGADATVRWTSHAPKDDVDDHHHNTTTVVSEPCSAPVVCLTTLSPPVPQRYGNVILPTTSSPLFEKHVVVGTMDGHVTMLHSIQNDYDDPESFRIVMDDSSSLSSPQLPVFKKHDKYVSSISWIQDTLRPTMSWLATSSADGTIHIYTVTAPNGSTFSPDVPIIHHMESFYYDHPVTCICYAQDRTDNGFVLYVYVRNTPHLVVLRMPSLSPPDGTKRRAGSGGHIRLHLNASLHDTHVSFAVLDMKISPDHLYLALACDNHCHLIIANNHHHCYGEEEGTSLSSRRPTQQARIVRKLYGHVADAYSRPMVAWSCDNQYIYSNTQNDTKLCIYSLASGRLLEDDLDQESIKQPHERPIKDLCSHPYQNLLVTTSFDRQTIVWAPAAASEEIL